MNTRQSITIWRKALTTLLGLSLCVLGASYAGVLHPLADSLAVFRLHIGLGCLALSLLCALCSRTIAGIGALISIAALAPILWAMLIGPSGQPGAFSLYQKNMLFRPRDLSPLIADIRTANPDILTLQEVTPGNEALLTALADQLPSQLICPFARVGAVAVASRWPVIEGQQLCLERQGLAGLQVQSPNGPLWAISIHLHWPYPHGQAAQRENLLPHLKTLDGPVLIGGDFNMVPWSHALRSIAHAANTRRTGRAFNSMTRFSPWVPLPIDHVLLPQTTTGSSEKRPLLGSDHHGILARFDF